jgi:hypothetical protein
MKHREEFHHYMNAVNRTMGSNDDHHLTDVQMIAYCRDEMSVAEHDAAESHLVSCEQCVQLFRNARDFLDPARDDEDQVTAAETDEAWQSFQERVQREAPTSTRSEEANVLPGRFPLTRSSTALRRVTLLLAASLLISFGAVGWQTWRWLQERHSRRQSQELASQLESRQRELEQQLRQLEQSGNDQLKREHEQRLALEAERDRLQTQLETVQQAAQQIPEYVARLTSERGTEDEVRIRFSGPSKLARLRLMISKPYEYPFYAIELSDQSGRILLRRSGLRPSGDAGELRLLVNRSVLSAGRYELRLFAGKEQKPLGEYGLSVSVAR